MVFRTQLALTRNLSSAGVVYYNSAGFVWCNSIPFKKIYSLDSLACGLRDYKMVYDYTMSFSRYRTIRMFTDNPSYMPDAQLLDNINFIYSDLIINTLYDMNDDELEGIKDKIRSGTYKMKPLNIRMMEKSELNQYLRENIHDCPEITCHELCIKSKVCILKPDNKEDALVLMGLALTLFNRIRNIYNYNHNLITDGYRMEHLLDSFFDKLVEVGVVERIYKIDLYKTIDHIDKTYLLNKVNKIIGDGTTFNLIKQFIDNPVLDERGNKLNIERTIPRVGEITRVLIDILYNDFEAEFTDRFPGIKCYRFINEVYVLLKENDNPVINIDDISSILAKLNFRGTINSIVCGDKPLVCYDCKEMSIDNDGSILLFDRHEYHTLQK